MKLITFEKALSLADTNKHLLLGNGFSIDWRKDIFKYDALVNKADFSPLTGPAIELFALLKTKNFETVIDALRKASTITKLYQDSDTLLSKQLSQDADQLKSILANTIAKNHPDHPLQITESEYQLCRKFLSNFKCIYNLNYDLLLYWVLMHTETVEKIKCDDGFRNSEDEEAEYVIWDNGNSYEQNIHYLHGALHIFDAGIELQKYTWKKTGIRLIEQIRKALDMGLFPLIVTEGTSGEKITKINHSGYLHKAKRSFASIGGSLFIHGHSLSDYDDHIIMMIPETKINKLFISTTSDPFSPSNSAKILKLQRIIEERKELLKTRNPTKRAIREEIEVYFYQADTAHVWR